MGKPLLLIKSWEGIGFLGNLVNLLKETISYYNQKTILSRY